MFNFKHKSNQAAHLFPWELSRSTTGYAQAEMTPEEQDQIDQARRDRAAVSRKERLEDEAKRYAEHEAAAQPFRDDRLARKRAAFEKRQPKGAANAGQP